MKGTHLGSRRICRVHAPAGGERGQISQELRIARGDGAFSYLAGIFAYRQDTTFDQDNEIGSNANRLFPWLGRRRRRRATAGEGAATARRAGPALGRYRMQ